MNMKKALEELGKALKDLVEELIEDQQSQQLPVGCVHYVDEPQVLKQEEKECQQGTLPLLWP